MIDLKDFAAMVLHVDSKVPEKGWTSVNDIHKSAVVDVGLEYSITMFVEFLKMMRLHVRPAINSTRRWQYEVSRERKSTEQTPVELNTYRRTFIAFLESRIEPGTSYPASEMYDAFRRQFQCPQLGARTLGRALQRSPFTTVTKRHRLVCTRFIARKDDVQAEVQARSDARAARLIRDAAIAP